MPCYDFVCTAGKPHTFELTVDRSVRFTACTECGQPAVRMLSVGIAIGGMRTPTKYHDVNLNQAVEAQGEVLHAAERAGVEPPDLWGEAKQRIAAGEVRAVE